MRARVKRNISLYITLAALAVVCVCSFYRIFYIASHEQFKVISSTTPSPTASPEISWIPYSNDYFSLSYPDSAKEQYLEKDANPAVVTGWVVHQSNPYMQFATQVLHEPEMTSITDFPAVMLRRIRSDIYTQVPVTADGISGVQFSRHTDSEHPAEFGAFFFANHMIYTFVLQEKDEAHAEQIYRHILSTLSFTNELK